MSLQSLWMADNSENHFQNRYQIIIYVDIKHIIPTDIQLHCADDLISSSKKKTYCS